MSSNNASSSSGYDSDSAESDIEEELEDPTVLEYARFHGLCTDYSLELPRANDARIPWIDDIETDLRDRFDSPETNPVSELIKERLALSKEGARLLRLVLDLQQAPEEDALLPLDEWRRAEKLKQEAPILRTDPELDVLNFGSANILSFTNLQIPFEIINEENDEGLEWPVKYHAYPAQCDKQARVEKMRVTKVDLVFLQNALWDTWTPEDSEKIKEGSLNEYKPNPTWQPLTPPLLPLTPPMTPYIPSSPGNHLEIPSESTGSVAVEAKVFQDSIMAADTLVLPDPDNSDPMLFDDVDPSQIISACFENPNSAAPKRKAEDLKVEGPLTPPMLSETPIKKMKSVSFPETLHEYIPELPSQYASGDDVLGSQDSFADFFRDEIEPYHEEVTRRLENERLSEVDTTTRVDVPALDFSLPVSPWNEYRHKSAGKHPSGETELDAQMKFLLRVKRNDLKSAASWHGSSKLERKFSWEAFPDHKGEKIIHESLHGEEHLNKMLAELAMGDIATSSSQVWKRDGLRILEGVEDDDDELEPAEVKDQNGMDDLIRKRALGIEEEDAETRSKTKKMKVPAPVLKVSARQKRETKREVIQSHHWAAPVKSARQKTAPLRPSQSPQPPHKSKDDNSLMFGGEFSATTALQRFMEMHGKPIKSEDARETKAYESTRRSVPTAVALPSRPAERPQTYLTGHPVASKERSTPPPALPKLPPVPTNLTSCSFIVSSTLLQQRNLTREIEKLYPNADLSQRDFTAPHSAAQEADLLLSPSTGLIVTSLQLVKQRALPGQPDRSPIKERVMKLQHRYERLVVVISEGLSRETEGLGSSRPVDGRDKEAIAAFERFASKMEGEVIVQYVRGGELALARSIVTGMAKWGLPHGSQDIGDLKVVQDEGCWELFLRRAGLNAYAAQIIIASLLTPFHLPLTSSSPYKSESSTETVEVKGLAAFILMSAEERVQKFQVLLGGSRILNRVSKVLDQEWPSAVNGFAVQEEKSAGKREMTWLR